MDYGKIYLFLCTFLFFASLFNLTLKTVNISKIKFIGEIFNKNKNYYAIISSTNNIVYFFPLPLTVLVWRKLGVQSIVILTGKKEDYQKDYLLNNTLNFLEQIQTVRLFAAGLPLTKNFDIDNDIFITTDSDMFTFELSHHVPNFTNGEEVKLFNSRCCGSVTVRGRKVRHIPLNSIAMSIRMWREIMEFGSNPDFNGDKMYSYLVKIFGDDFLKKNPQKGGPLWYTDQHLFSFKFDQWIRKNANNTKLIGEYTNKPKRIDRIRWPTSFENITVTDYDDCHIVHGIHKNEQWKRLWPLLEKIFDDDEETLSMILKYKDRSLKSGTHL